MNIPTRSRNELGFILLLTFLLFFAASCSMVKGKEAAEKAVTQFHSQYNARDFLVIYDQASQELRNLVTETQFLNVLIGLRQQLGDMKDANLQSINVKTQFGGPNQVELLYETNFEKGKGTERFTWQVSGDKAVLFGYNVSSPVLNQQSPDSGAKVDSQPSSDKEDENKEANLTDATEGRGILSLQEVLLGHWISTDGKTHLYINRETFIRVSEGKVVSRIYSVQSADERTNKIKLEVGEDGALILAFSHDRRTMSMSNPEAAVQPINWVFVDDKQHP